MLLRPLFLSSALVSLFLLAACSEPQSSHPEVAQETVVEEAKSTLKTTGTLSFDGLPPNSVSVAEVIVVSKLSDDARRRIKRQRELFEYKITGRVEEPVGASSVAGVSAVDAARLEAKLAQLPAAFPPVCVDDVDLGNNRLRKYQSDSAMFKEYKYLFSSLKLGNFERGLKFIGEKFETDNKALVAASDEADDDGYQQAAVTLKWLLAVQQHYNAYVELAKEHFDAKNRYFEEQAQAGPLEPTDWDAYVARYANFLIMDTSENLEGAAFAAEDGSFEVEGHGTVIVRVELGMASAYFLPGSEKEERVRVEGLQQL